MIYPMFLRLVDWMVLLARSSASKDVYRHVIVPAIRGGASIMDDVFSDEDEESA
jgi:hypothetical protein